VKVELVIQKGLAENTINRIDAFIKAGLAEACAGCVHGRNCRYTRDLRVCMHMFVGARNAGVGQDAVPYWPTSLCLVESESAPALLTS
jgi:hypothetical protein